MRSPLRSLANLMIVGAYLEVLLVAVGIGLTAQLWRQGEFRSTSLFLLSLVIWIIGGVALFLSFKCLGEIAQAAADFADREADVSSRPVMPVNDDVDTPQLR